MERIIQYLDDLDDLFSAAGLFAEQLRNLIYSLAFVCASLALQIGGILLALNHPPLALAAALLMCVALLYRSVTVPIAAVSQPL